MVKKLKIIVIVIILTTNAHHAQNIKKDKMVLSPVFKSIILPGWGQYSLDHPKRGNFFISGEILGISLSAFSFIKSNNVKDIYIAMAAEHAGTNESGKGHQYWVDIGNYNSSKDYNDEHLRWREYDALYPDDEMWRWQWDSEKNRERFENLRIESDNYELIGKFLIGGIIINHIISAIDAFYLKNISISDTVEVLSFYNPQRKNLSYSLQISF